MKRGEKEILSLEEILAEGNSAGNVQQPLAAEARSQERENKEFTFNKVQMKALQEAMYHSVESNHLGECRDMENISNKCVPNAIFQTSRWNFVV